MAGDQPTTRADGADDATARPQVVIVGGGPVGVGLAVDLGLRGISCAIIERRETLSPIPKGQALTQRTMEHCFRWGIADEIREARAMPPGYPMGMAVAYGTLMSEFWQAPPARELVEDYYFQANERLPQYGTEEVLRRRMAALPTVTPYFGFTATGVEQDDDGVRVTVERDGHEQVIEASYVVGCDGGRSLVRSQTKIEQSGTDWDELVALVVFRSPELHQALEQYPQISTYRVMHPDLEGYWMFFGRVDVGEQFFFHAPVPPDTTRDSFDVAALLHRAAGSPFAFEVDHVGFWDLRVEVANEYRRGRAFIAGDAAHTHPPYGGFGLNNGLEDAANLGWKLAAVLQGWGGDDLLESYSQERQTVFHEIGEDIIGGWIAYDRAFLERYDPAIDRVEFEQQFAEMAKEYGRRFSALEPNYEGSAVVIGPPGGVTSARGKHTFVAQPGHHLAPSSLSSGKNVFEVLGTGFTLLSFDGDDAAVAAFEDAADRFGVPLTVIRDTAEGERGRYQARLILVRPDEYVVWVGDAAPADASDVLERVAGRGDRPGPTS